MLLLKEATLAESVRQEFKARLAKVPLPQGYDRIYAVPETFFASFARLMVDDWEAEAPADRLLAILLTAATLFMILPAVNLVNLNVSRALERASEIGVRRAFGASSRDLTLQFLFENVIVSVAGGALALLMAGFALFVLNRSDVIPYAHFSLNLRIAGWGFLFALVFGVISGVWPAWRLSRLKPVAALAGGGR